MNNDSINRAGEGLSGKEEDRRSDELVTRTRRAKLTRRAAGEESETGTGVVATEDTEKSDDLYYDALLRFGIQI